MDLRASAASVLYWLVIFLTCAAVSGVITAKAFYCRDPDTRKLYPVNSTWHSSSFCGRYTCKLRMKGQDNQTTTQQILAETKPTTDDGLTKNASQPVGVIVKDKPKVDVKNDNVIDNEKTYIKLEKFKVDEGKNIQLAASTLDGDRYLTEEEITALSLLLQTMKKSDLEAILEVYNLAQDIYKELDKIEFAQNVTQGEKSIENQPSNNEIAKRKSYWYEPLTAASNKIKEAAEIVEAQQEQPYVHTQPVLSKVKPTNIPKSFYEGLNMLQNIKNQRNILTIVPMTKMEEKSFFEGPLARNDFRKLPYYHPLTNFQKLASYVRPTETIAQSETSYAQSVNSPAEIYSAALYPSAYLQLRQYSPLSNQPKKVQQAYMQQQLIDQKSVNPYPQNQNEVQSENHRAHGKCRKKPEPPFRLIPWSELVMKTDERKKTFISEKNNEPNGALSFAESKLTAQNLDLPFAYLQNYNLSSINPYNGENAWSLLNLGSKPHRRHPSYRGYVAQIPHDDISDASVSAEVKHDEQVQNIKNSMELPDWQTSPLALNELNEVKANIAKSKFLPYPFRKKVRLERVGRVRNIESGERTKRNFKRDVDTVMEVAQEEYEVYIEKSTCQTDTEPGFFRMGNISQPYPACCPERISS